MFWTIQYVSGVPSSLNLRVEPFGQTVRASPAAGWIRKRTQRVNLEFNPDRTPVRIIAASRIREYAVQHSRASAPLLRWLDITRIARWNTIADVRSSAPSADPVVVSSGKTVIVFNIGGNKFRLIAAVHYSTQIVYVLRMMTHAEYSKNRWKKEL